MQVLGWIRHMGLLAALGALVGCDTDGPNRTGDVELSEVAFRDGSVVPVCTERAVEPSQPGYLNLSDISSPDIAVFEAMDTPVSEQDRIRSAGTEGTFWYAFAESSGGDFKTASVRANLARCDFAIPGGMDRSTLFTVVVGNTDSLSYVLHHREGRVEYIEVRRRDSQS